jgi:GH24 family phage-related lysozyme (muramidase)
MLKNPRIVVAALSLSAAGLFALVKSEGYTETAVVPTKGDRFTVGFGSTFNEDGSPVKIGDKTNPVQALQRTLAYTAKTDSALRQCVKVPLHQEEFDLLNNHSYQYGVNSTCSSPMVRRANIGDYAGSCHGYLDYKYAAGYDCSALVNGKPNKRCWGVWERSLWRHEQCMAVQ